MNDELQAVFEGLRADLDQQSPAAAARRLMELAPSEVADLFAPIGTAERILLVRQMPAEQAAAVLSEIDDRSLGDVLELLQDREIVELLDELPSDDAADLVGYLDEEDQDRVIEMLDRVDHQDAVEICLSKHAYGVVAERLGEFARRRADAAFPAHASCAGSGAHASFGHRPAAS